MKNYGEKDTFIRSPRRGSGSRNLECTFYGACLALAAERNWRQWKCDYCDGVGFGSVESEERTPKEKPVNSRMCKECGDRPTMHPNAPLCGVCMGARSKVARAAKKEAAAKGEHGGNNKGGVEGRSSSLDPIHGSPRKSMDDRVVTVDFSMHTELFMGLEKLSGAEFRSIEGEILSLVAQAVKQHSEERRV